MTRQFPKGRIHATDDGQMTYAIAFDPINQRTIIKFFEPMDWIGMDREAVLQLRNKLNEHLGRFDQLDVVTHPDPIKTAAERTIDQLDGPPATYERILSTFSEQLGEIMKEQTPGDRG